MNIDASAIEWARAQFALTAIYHWLFVPLTLGLAVVMGIMETCYYRTRKPFWKDVTRFWQRLFGINFAMGVATGIILEFEFGTNWSNYSWFVGDIFGAPLAVEGILAFFMESTFVAVMFFGWKKVSPGFHLASTWLTGIGATLSAWWILCANAWMQYPVGCTFNPDTMRNEMTSFLDVAFSPFAIDKFCHAVTSSWIIGALFTVGISCYYLLKRRHTEMAVASIKIGGIVGLVAALAAMGTGDGSAHKVAQVQPMKLAAMEALYEGGNDQGLTIVALVNPFSQPDYAANEEHGLKIDAPYVLSMLATRDIHGYVPGINDIIRGYTSDEGVAEPSLDEKIARGKGAITALKRYRELRGTEGAEEEIAACCDILNADMQYFGYGFIRDAADIVPYIPVCFWAFRVMVGLGCLFTLFFIIVLFLAYRKDITRFRWIHIAALCIMPFGWIASESGWIVAELGRQPWAIQDLLPTWVGISNISAGTVITTFIIFLVLFTTLLSVEVSILVKQIKRGMAED